MSEFFRAGGGGGGGDSPCREKAINYVDCTAAPPSENTGDRYILDDTAGTVHANWDGAAKLDVVTFDGSVWVKETPEEGWLVYLTTPDYYMLFTDGAWEIFLSGTAAVAAHESTYDHSLLHDPVTAGTGIDVTDQVVTNTDLGSDAVVNHESTYDHGLLHDPATSGVGIYVDGQEINNTDTGTDAVNNHLGDYAHGDIADNTSARHAQSHALSSGSDHTGTLAATQMAVSGTWTIAASSTLSLAPGNAASFFSVSCPIAMPTAVVPAVVTVQDIGGNNLLYPVVNLPATLLPLGGTADVFTSDMIWGVASYSMVFNSGTDLVAKVKTDGLQLGDASNLIGCYWGDSVTDGSWRIIRNGNDLLIQRRESGSWVTKLEIPEEGYS